ncbi:MAG: hypothetical protein LBT17_00890 [Mycoplasmataceae bacterium]|jgi:hypothetical protein|nr:hypothetical protein [Mycoplasmataceae bacterium]
MVFKLYLPKRVSLEEFEKISKADYDEAIEHCKSHHNKITYCEHNEKEQMVICHLDSSDGKYTGGELWLDLTKKCGGR